MATPYSGVLRTRGFTVMEVLVALGIVAILAAMMIPAVKARLDAAEAAAITDNLRAVRTAVLAYRDNVNRYPRYLTQLQGKPSITIGDVDLCDNFLPTRLIDSWRGPYLAQRVTTLGMQVGNSIVANQLSRNQAFNELQPEGYLIVEVQDVVVGIAREVDRAFDPLNFGIVDLTSGAISWESGLLRFYIAVRGC